MTLKKGEKYKCEKCGMVVTVNSPCTCETCNITCCGASLKKIK